MLLRSMVLECFKARLSSAAGTADSSDGCALTEGVLPLSPSPAGQTLVNIDPDRHMSKISCQFSPALTEA
jgi:hypothetical protein